MMPDRNTPFGRPSDQEAVAMLKVTFGLLHSNGDQNELQAARQALRRLYLDGFTSNPGILKMAGLTAAEVQAELDELDEHERMLGYIALLELCGRPNPNEARYQADIAAIANRYKVEQAKLEVILKEQL